MSDASTTRDCYVRYTDKEGRSRVVAHRVWDADRFIEARKAEAAKEGGKADAQAITLEQFIKEKA